MITPGAPSLLLLFYVLVFLPVAAVRSVRRLRTRELASPTPELREAIWIGTLVNLAVLFLLSWFVGRGFGFQIFAVGAIEPTHVLAAMLAFGGCFVLRSVARAMRTEEERRSMAVYVWAPRTRREQWLWTATVLMAGVAEEAAYRGVGMAILTHAFGNAWLPVLMLATAFAIAHSTQGWKSAVIVFPLALVMHWLVAFTGTLILAMVVHAVYDLWTGVAIARKARVYDAEQKGSDPF